MTTITDWLMVVITGIYVIATVFICTANMRSADAAREQTDEAKREYEETKRLEIMPYIICEPSDNVLPDKKLRLLIDSNSGSGNLIEMGFLFKNIGNGPAKDVVYKWKNITDCYERGHFFFRALESHGKSKLLLEFIIPDCELEYISASIVINYKDIIENKYQQVLEFQFEKQTGCYHLRSAEMSAPEQQKR